MALGTAAAADRAALQGTWRLDPRHGQEADKLKAETLSIAQKGDEDLQITDAITDTDGKLKKTEFGCNTKGRECKVQDGQVTLYYNGPMLVMIETRRGGDVVIKKLLKPSDDGSTLNMEIMRLVPPGAAENFTFSRQQPATTASQ